jgi:ribosomal protein S12 methylthiotransferase accessory factor
MVGKERRQRLTDMSKSDSADQKAYRRGTHRTVAPAETLARVQPLMSQMGITRVANVTGLDRIGLPVVMAFRPNSRSIAVSQGKGLDLDAAKASGLMEAVETYHAERIELPLKLGSLEDLTPNHRLVDVDRIPKIVGSRFRPTLSILWIEGRDLITESPVWLPYELVHANYTLPLPTGSGCFPASTNGLASGNHALEAICHGLAEVVERDSTAVWNHLDRQARDRTRIALDTVEDPACQEVLEKLYRTELSVAVWETTSDLGIASFLCMITDDRAEAHLGLGAGCHPMRSIALARALTEAVQVRTTYITGARDDLPPDQYTQSGRKEKLRQAQALMVSDVPGRPFSDGPSMDCETFEEDLAWMLRKLQAKTIEQVIVVDLTRLDFGLPVVRVVVPGLEAPDDDEDYVPGPRVLAVMRKRK